MPRSAELEKIVSKERGGSVPPSFCLSYKIVVQKDFIFV